MRGDFSSSGIRVVSGRKNYPVIFITRVRDGYPGTRLPAAALCLSHSQADCKLLCCLFIIEIDHVEE